MSGHKCLNCCKRKNENQEDSCLTAATHDAEQSAHNEERESDAMRFPADMGNVA